MQCMYNEKSIFGFLTSKNSLSMEIIIYINHKRTVSCKRLAFIPFVQQCVSPEGSSDINVCIILEINFQIKVFSHKYFLKIWACNS